MTESLTRDETLPTENEPWTGAVSDQQAGTMSIGETSVGEGSTDPFEDGSEAEGLTPISPAAMGDLAAGDGNGYTDAAPRDLRLLADIRVEVTVEMGRVRLPLRDLLRLAPGAVLELDRAAGDGVDVLVNGTPVARGEVFVVDGDFGVRITEILGRR